MIRLNKITGLLNSRVWNFSVDIGNVIVWYHYALLYTVSKYLSYRGGLLRSLASKSVLGPALLSCAVLLISSTNCLHIFTLLLLSDFTATTVNTDLLLGLSAAKIGAAVMALSLGRKIGLKMLLLLGQLQWQDMTWHVILSYDILELHNDSLTFQYIEFWPNTSSSTLDSMFDINISISENNTVEWRWPLARCLTDDLLCRVCQQFSRLSLPLHRVPPHQRRDGLGRQCLHRHHLRPAEPHHPAHQVVPHGRALPCLPHGVGRPPGSRPSH